MFLRLATSLLLGFPSSLFLLFKAGPLLGFVACLFLGFAGNTLSLFPRFAFLFYFLTQLFGLPRPRFGLEAGLFFHFATDIFLSLSPDTLLHLLLCALGSFTCGPFRFFANLALRLLPRPAFFVELETQVFRLPGTNFRLDAGLFFHFPANVCLGLTANALFHFGACTSVGFGFFPGFSFCLGFGRQFRGNFCRCFGFCLCVGFSLGLGRKFRSRFFFCLGFRTGFCFGLYFGFCLGFFFGFGRQFRGSFCRSYSFCLCVGLSLCLGREFGGRFCFCLGFRSGFCLCLRFGLGCKFRGCFCRCFGF